MADRFDEVVMPLLTAGLTTSRGLALNLRQHIPAHIASPCMRKEDRNRTTRGETLVNKDELIAMYYDAIREDILTLVQA